MEAAGEGPAGRGVARRLLREGDQAVELTCSGMGGGHRDKETPFVLFFPGRKQIQFVFRPV